MPALTNNCIKQQKLKQRYKDIPQQEWFKKAYENQSLGFTVRTSEEIQKERCKAYKYLLP